MFLIRPVIDLRKCRCESAAYRLPGAYFRTYNLTGGSIPLNYPYFNRTDDAIFFGITQDQTFSDKVLPWSINPLFTPQNQYSFTTFFYGYLLYKQSNSLNITMYADDWVITWTREKTLNISYASRDSEYLLYFLNNNFVPPNYFTLSVQAGVSVPITTVYSNREGGANYNYTYDINRFSTVSFVQ